MMSRHFGLSSELTGAIAKKLPHAKNQVSGPDSFFNQFVTYMLQCKCETGGFANTPVQMRNLFILNLMVESYG